MWQTIGTILSIGMQIFGYYVGNKKDKQKYAKEILKLFKGISSDGENLFNDLSKEMNRRSDVDWNDIEVRGNGDQGETL